MKFALATLALAGAANALTEDAQQLLVANSFAEFTETHGKTYATEEEKTKRMSIFAENLDKIAAKNAKLRELGYDEVHGVNRFTDLTEEEFKFFLGVDATIEPAKLEVFDGPLLNATGSYNLNDDGLITAVKDQAQCGSCWAFSATETIESAWAKAGNKLTEFSPQQIVSCDTKDNGCNGGLPTQAFDYVKGAGGMATDAAYPYTSGRGNSGTCQDFTPVGGTVSSWAYTQSPAGRFSSGNTEDSDAMISALHQYGGISIAIDASQWNSYTGGIMQADSGDCSSKPSKMDHAVQVVGYNADAEQPYWIVRNSWTTQWGESGYIRLAMGDNTCGIANLAAYVSKV